MRDIIAAGLADLGLLDRVPGQAPSQLAEYGHLLLEKNQVMNLTAITDPVKVAQLHMLDCAALLTCADFENRALLDVGTGAGFPGLPLKILVPSLQVTLLDSLNKRVDWLAQVSAQLSLTGIRVIHARAEEQALEKGFRDSFELVTARAVAELRLLCELCLPYVKVGGAFLAMKSVDCGRELEEAVSMANVIKERSSLALHMAKAAVDQGRNHDLYTALEIEARNDAMLFDTADFREGMLAFSEKRPPVFRGR